MTNEEKKEKLQKYLIAVDRLTLKCNDASRWESMSLGPSGNLSFRSGSHEPDEIKETAIQLRQECESLAVNVRRLRQDMSEAFSLMPNDRLRVLLECKYVDGMTDGDLCEKFHYSKRHFYRLMSQALADLDERSSYFSKDGIKCH